MSKKQQEKEKEIINQEELAENEEIENSEEECTDDILEIKKTADENYDKFLRVSAEFDNYKKRTLKEREDIYNFSAGNVIVELLPVIDNLERAIESTKEESPILEGVNMVLKQFLEILEKMGVKAIETADKTFDPNLHNAVMHVEDENFGENIIVEEFMKGYMFKDKVIRHSMVKVAN